MHRVYLDTEFTSLHRAKCKLISLALAVFEGPELYVELSDTWTESDCSNFVRTIVLPQLDHSAHGQTANEARLAIQSWLSRFDSVLIYTDAEQWDWYLLKELLGKEMPTNVTLGEITADLLDSTDIAETPHHALEDARLLARIVETDLGNVEG